MRLGIGLALTDVRTGGGGGGGGVVVPFPIVDAGVVLDARAITGIEDAATFQAWANDGTEADAAASVDTKRPAYHATGNARGGPYVEFTVGDCLRVANSASLNFEAALTFLVVCRKATNGSGIYHHLLSKDNNTSGGEASFFFWPPAAGTIRFDRPFVAGYAAVSSGYANDSWARMAVRITGGASPRTGQHYINGSPVGSSFSVVNGTATTGDLFVGAFNDAETTPSGTQGAKDMACAIAISRALTDEEMAAADAWLAAAFFPDP